MPSNDPLLQPYKLRHLTLKNRVMSTSARAGLLRGRHAEGALSALSCGKGQGRHCADHDGGFGDRLARRPAAFGNLHAYRDEIVPWLRELADDCHEHDCKVMIQLTHLGRRTGWNKGDWLPVLAPPRFARRRIAPFPKEMEDWDIERIVADYASAAQRMQAAGLDGIEFEAYGHLMDAFWSPATNQREDDYGGSLDNRLRFTWAVIDAVRKAVGPDFIVGIRMVADEDCDIGLSQGGRHRNRTAPGGFRQSSISSTSSAAISIPTRH